jgi:hypothetical protein
VTFGLCGGLDEDSILFAGRTQVPRSRHLRIQILRGPFARSHTMRPLKTGFGPGAFQDLHERRNQCSEDRQGRANRFSILAEAIGRRAVEDMITDVLNSAQQ